MFYPFAYPKNGIVLVKDYGIVPGKVLIEVHNPSLVDADQSSAQIDPQIHGLAKNLLLSK